MTDNKLCLSLEESADLAQLVLNTNEIIKILRRIEQKKVVS
jgi:hypothetical protein